MGVSPNREPMKVSALATARVGEAFGGGSDQDPGFLKSIDRLNRAADLMAAMEPPSYPPGVGPAKDDPIRTAQDADLTLVSQYASQVAPGLGFLGFPFLAELSQIVEYRQMSERLAEEMTRQWISFKTRSEDDKSDQIKQLQQEFDRLHVRERFREAAKLDGFFGRGQIYMDLGINFDDPEVGAPLIYDNIKIQKGSLKRLQVIEPLYSYAYDYDAGEPLSRDFYRPRAWYVMKRKVHNSRLLTFISRPVPTMLKPMYAFSGLSLSQLAMPTVENFLRMRDSIARIARNYSLRGIKSNLAAILQGGGTEAVDSLVNRVQIMTAQASNEGVLLLDKDLEDFFQHTTPLTNLDRLLDQARDNMCAVGNIPRMVLFGLSPEGMNASADGELKVFEQYVAGMQEVMFRGPLETLMVVAQLSLWGKVDPDIVVDFNPLRELDEKEVAELRYQNAQADNIYVTTGVVAAEEVRKRLAHDPNSGWQNIDLSKKVEIAVPQKAPNPTGSQPNDVEPPKPAETK